MAVLDSLRLLAFGRCPVWASAQEAHDVVGHLVLRFGLFFVRAEQKARRKSQQKQRSGGHESNLPFSPAHFPSAAFRCRVLLCWKNIRVGCRKLLVVQASACSGL